MENLSFELITEERARKINDELYHLRYVCPNKSIENANAATKSFNVLWNSLKNDTVILEEAIKIIKNRFNENTLKFLSICDVMLCYSDDISKEIYLKLVDEIYSNKDIARIVVNGYSNGGYSFLLYTLMDSNLKLTAPQKAFAIDEALNKSGTVRAIKNECDKSINAQAHGRGYFDIRYHILFNDNFTNEEKADFAYEAYADSRIWSEFLEQLVFDLQNDYSELGYRGYFEQALGFSDDEIISLVGDKYAKKFIKNTKIINFLREARPQYAVESKDEQKIIK